MAVKRWAELRPGVVADLGDEALAEARRRTQCHINAHRLAGQRKGLDLTRADVAERMD